FVAGELDVVARWDAAAPKGTAPDDLGDKLAGLSGRRRESALLDHLVATAAALTGLAPDEVETDRPVREIGLDSVSAVELVERTARALGRHVPVTALFDYPTLESLARHLCAEAPVVTLPSSAPPSATHAAVAAMSEDEATAALLAELARLK
ncbi:MAG: acyl carrier protein, partial [Deltaproteobacteria bacterium]|nr:acyl carrier protein [Deltaproteobacteria bacterium]